MMHHNIKKVTLAVAAALLSGAACAGTQIPLTVEDALRVAAADQQNSIEVGARTVQANGSGTTSFNAWNGAEESKSSIDADMHLQGGDGAHTWSIQGRDIGTEIPEMHAEYNTVGTFGVEADYKRFRHLSHADQRVYLNDFEDIEQIRDVYRVGAYWLPTDNIDLRAAYQLDDRRGNKSQNASAGQWGHPHATFAGDIDDQHHQAEVSAEWSFNAVSLEASYYLSKYENNEPKIVRNLNGSIAAATIDPSNTLHRVGLDGLWQISDTSTLSVSAGYSWNKLEDSTYEAVFTVQDQLQVMDPNYDAETKIPTFDIAYTARPLDSLSVSAKYGYRKVDNSVDSHGFSYNTGTWVPGTYTFKDMSRTEHKLTADAIYNLGQGYSVKGWASMLDKSYESTIEGNTEWKAGLELRKRMSSALSGKIAYQYTNRSAEDWRTAIEWYNTDTGNILKGRDSYWSLAAYDEHELKLDLNSDFTDSLTLGFYSSVYTRSYGDTEGPNFGVDDSKGVRFGLDADFAVSRDWSIFAFYDFDYQKLENHAMLGQLDPGSSNSSHYGSPWKSNKDTSHTLGFGVDLHPELQPWSLKVQYVYGLDKSDFDTIDRADVTVGTPDAEYKTHYAEASGTWRVNKDWALEGSMLYGKVDSEDYLRENKYLDDTLSNTYDYANYSAALFYLGVKYNLPM